MRKILTLAAALLPVAAAFAAMPRHPVPVHREGEVLVTYRDAVAAKQAGATRSRLGLTIRRQLRGGRVQLLALPSYLTTRNAIALLRDDPAVASARPNFLRFPRQAPPDDTYFGDQWGLHNTGQANFVAGGPAGVPGADMDMLAAWDPDGDGVFDRVGDGTVTIAIIDDGFATSHEDLAANFVAGCNFEDSDTCGDTDVTPVGSEQHGTFVAGAAGAIGNNGVGVAGTAWNVKLMPLKFGLDTAGHLAALEFAAANGADIVNASFGGPGFDQAEQDAINDLAAADILYVASAGNDDSNTDLAQLNYPANLDAPNIVSVAATNRQDAIASFSQYGALTTDVAAPGLQILTTSNGTNIYATAPGVTGTSFSSPYTAGIAALVRMAYPSASHGEVKARLIEGAEPGDGVNLRTAGGRVNAANSLNLAPRPSLVIESVDWVDGGNGVLDPGETLSVDITLRNLWLDATGVSGTLSADEPVTVTSGAVGFGAIAADGTATASFDLAVDGAVSDHRYVHFTLALTADGGYTASRGFIAEIGQLLAGVVVNQAFASRDADLYDEFHAWHFDLTTLPAGHNQLVIQTTSDAPGFCSPDLDLLVKRDEPPRYSITVGVNPESPSGFFCTSGTTENCQDPQVFLSADFDGHEGVAINNPAPGTYHVVIVNFAQLPDGMDYTLRAFTRASTSSQASLASGCARRSVGGGSLPLPALALLALAALRRRPRRAA
jgi:hypothetical protein